MRETCYAKMRKIFYAGMRKTSSSKFPAWAIFYVLFFLLVFNIAVTEVKAGGQCVVGTYKHEGRECCLCGVGLKLVEHCTTNLENGVCEPCDPGTFSSHPSSEKTCSERCRSCNHPNENLEVEEACTSARDTKCRCKQDHYCVSNTDICHLCHPCTKCGAEGIKVPCAGNKDTVCNEKTEELGAGAIAGIVIAVFALLFIALVAMYIWNKKRKQNKVQQPDGNSQSREMQLLNIPDVEIQPLIPKIAKVVGWKDMKNIAMQSGILKTEIENCEQDHPGDSEEQTIQLLQIWAEKVGRGGPGKLIDLLEQGGKRDKAEKVAEIVKNAALNLP